MFVESVLPNDFFEMLNFLPAAGSNKATGQLLQSPNDSHNYLTFESPIKVQVKVLTARFRIIQTNPKEIWNIIRTEVF